jgi:hypothetical protein
VTVLKAAAWVAGAALLACALWFGVEVAWLLYGLSQLPH